MRKIIQLTESDLQNIVTESVKRILTENDDNSNNPENLPRLAELGDGTYDGTLKAHCFNYNGKDYWLETGIRTMIPQPWTVTIKNGKVVK